MKKSNFILLIIFALILRLLFINKEQGLWNDEYVSWMISQKPFFGGFWKSIFAQCHMPFYYIYLKILTKCFGNSDFLLRLTSIIPALVSIPIMYLVGKEADSRRTGKYCAVFCAISSFLIFYSQEVRLYSLLFLISALSLLFTLKILKSPSNKNIIGYLISNFFILFTHTIGFVYVFFNLLYVSIKLFKSHKSQIKTIWLTIFVCGLIFSPQVIKILTEKTFSQWWGHFTPSKILFVFTDYFSPYLVNLTNAPDKFFYNPTLKFFLFCIIPSCIAFGFLIKSLYKRTRNLQLLFLSILTLSILIIASIAGKLVLLTKYSIEIYPILILLVCIGAGSIENRILRRFLVSIYIILSLFFMFTSPKAAQRMPRTEGHNIVAKMLYNCKLKDGDIILIQYYGKDRFGKYFDFSKYKTYSMNKGNFPKYLINGVDYSMAYKNGKTLYKPLFLGENNDYFIKTLDNEILSDMQSGQNLVVITFDGVAMLSDENLKTIASNEQFYSKVPIMYLIFSYLKNKTTEQCLKTLEFSGYQSAGSWSAFKFTKVNK